MPRPILFLRTVFIFLFFFSIHLFAQGQANKHDASKSFQRDKISLDDILKFRNNGGKKLQLIPQSPNGKSASLNKVSGTKYAMTEEVSELWFDTTPDQERRLFFYDEKGNNTQTDLFAWENSAWKQINKGFSTYNESNIIIEYYNQAWYNSAWNNNFKETYVYDTNGNLIERAGFFWVSNVWSPSTQILVTYDEDSKQTESLFQWWNGSAWDNGSMEAFNYDENNNLVEQISKYWENSDWVNGERSTNSFDEKGNLTESIYEFWENSAWVKNSKVTLTYNAFDYQIGSLSSTWDGSKFGNATFRTTFSYDENQNNTEFLAEQNWDGSGWSNWNRVTRTYEKIVTGLNDVFSSTPSGFELKQNYPNPFNPSTTISFSLATQAYVGLQVFDLSGKEVARLVTGQKQAGTYSVQFNAAGLASGTYLYSLQTGNSVQTRKLTILK